MQEVMEMLEKSFHANVSMCYPEMNITKWLFLTRGNGIIVSIAECSPPILLLKVIAGISRSQEAELPQLTPTSDAQSLVRGLAHARHLGQGRFFPAARRQLSMRTDGLFLSQSVKKLMSINLWKT